MRVFINLVTGSLGDTIAWVPYAEEYRKKHKCEVVVSTHHNYLFEGVYPDLEFVDVIGPYAKDIPEGFDKKYRIDYWPLHSNDWDGYDNENFVDYRNISLQQIPALFLGLPLTEVKPKIKIEEKEPTIKGKYVVIAMQSTAQLKYWNYPGGWDILVKHLKDNGYKVVDIDLNYSFGIEGKWNVIPKGVNNKTGDIPLSDRINDIIHADFIITISSGLAWLSWSVGTPVVMISGFTKPYTEFQSGIHRIHNDSVCNGCWNRELFNSNDWMYCPDGKDFECTKSIKPREVIQVIDSIEDNIEIPVSDGEVVDKLSVLKLKKEKIKDRSKLTNIKKEYRLLKSKMEELDIYESDELFIKLYKVNKDLWWIEDKIRDKERDKEFDEEFIELARKVYHKNDERSRIKQEINLDTGSYLME